MADPSAQASNFTITVNSTPNPITSAALNPTKRSIILTLSSAIQSGDVVTISYNPGSLNSAIGVPVSAFSSSVTNKTNTAVDVISNKAIILYPNPFADRLFISNTNNYKWIKIVDMLGKEVLQTQLNQSGALEINTSKLKKGMYIIILANSNNQTIFKAVKK